MKASQKAESRQEEISFLRLLSRCEVHLSAERSGRGSGVGRAKLHQYLAALRGRADALRQLRSQGMALQIADELDTLSDRIDSMSARLEGMAGRKAEVLNDGDKNMGSGEALQPPHSPPVFTSGEQDDGSGEELPPGVIFERGSPVVLIDGSGDAKVQRLDTAGSSAAAKRHARTRRGFRTLVGMSSSNTRRGRGGLSTRERVEEERERGRDLEREIEDLTTTLKDLQLRISRFFRRDEKCLNEAQAKLEDNVSRVTTENKRLNKYLSESSGVCGTWSVLVFVASSLVGAIWFIRIFPL